MKLKTKKIILLTSGLGVLGALSASIATPIVLLNKNKDEKTITPKEKIIEIFWKIKNKDIFISPNASTSNQNEIENLIKNQLQKVNPLLTNDDLSKISTNLSSLTIGVGTVANLNIKVASENLSFKIFVEKINLLKNSNITNGKFGTIFQDDFGNLWAMGSPTIKTVDKVEKTIHTKLQVLKANQNGYVETGWTNDNSNSATALLKGSKIINGEKGVIFQDQFKNLWAMAKNSKLQVLKANDNKSGYIADGWNNSNSGLLQNSNISNGEKGTIFQDDFGNLWAMGKNSKLQVLRVNQSGNGYVTTGWDQNNLSSAVGLTKNSNITNGTNGKIFQDEFKNLWSLASGEKLQVLKANDIGNGYVNTGWINDNSSASDPLLKSSNINYGGNGTIFQDSFKNLWAMGGKKLQVLRANSSKNGYVKTGWTNTTRTGLTKNSNISEGHDGFIFQDVFKNLWSISWSSKIQVLKANLAGDGYVKTGWTNDNSNTGEMLLKNLSFGFGLNGTFFQDEFKNFWALKSDSKLQVLKIDEDSDVTTSWTNETNTGLLQNSNITNSHGGVIFQDKFKNLWAMGLKTSLQVLKANQDGTNYVDSWQN